MEHLIELLLHASEIDRQINLYDIRCAEVLRENRSQIEIYEAKERKRLLYNELAKQFDEINNKNKGINNE